MFIFNILQVVLKAPLHVTLVVFCWTVSFHVTCRFAALYYTDKICLEPLTPYFHMSDVRDGHLGHMCSAARSLDALVIALDQIADMYKVRLSPQPP